MEPIDKIKLICNCKYYLDLETDQIEYKYIYIPTEEERKSYKRDHKIENILYGKESLLLENYGLSDDYGYVNPIIKKIIVKLKNISYNDIWNEIIKDLEYKTKNEFKLEKKPTHNLNINKNKDIDLILNEIYTNLKFIDFFNVKMGLPRIINRNIIAGADSYKYLKQIENRLDEYKIIIEPGIDPGKIIIQNKITDEHGGILFTKAGGKIGLEYCDNYIRDFSWFKLI